MPDISDLVCWSLRDVMFWRFVARPSGELDMRGPRAVMHEYRPLGLELPFTTARSISEALVAFNRWSKGVAYRDAMGSGGLSG